MYFSVPPLGTAPEARHTEGAQRKRTGFEDCWDWVGGLGEYRPARLVLPVIYPERLVLAGVICCSSSGSSVKQQRCGRLGSLGLLVLEPSHNTVGIYESPHATFSPRQSSPVIASSKWQKAIVESRPDIERMLVCPVLPFPQRRLLPQQGLV